MAKKSIFDYDKWERKHVSRMGARARAVKKLFDELAQQASLLGIDVKLPSDKDFEFKNYPALEKRVDELVKEVSQKVTRIIEDGEEEAWIEANAKNDALVDSVVQGTGLPKEVVAQWKQPNLSALAAFQARKIAGMGLSQRVWKLTQTAKQELELALDLGIGEGKSAAELSRDIRRYLNEPNKLFRRVRDEKGILRLSKAAKMYHPGRGVYRSSYKNALRLTQTEINMAYRSSDHERWSQTDWIIGVRVSLSNNHTLNGLPFHDICDDVQGVYPKNFKFVGWHPKCRCHATPELAKREECIAYLKKMANGEDVSGYKFSGQTREVPQGFKDWVDKNAERVKSITSIPYFIKDNARYIPKKWIDGIGTLARGKDKGLALDLKEAIVKIKDPTFVTEKEVRVMVKNYADLNKDDFYGGLAKVKITKKGNGAMMACERKHYANTGVYYKKGGNTIIIYNDDLPVFDYSGKKIIFNPLYELKGAMKAIAEGKELTFNQEYAIEVLWHEIRHASAKGWKNITKKTEELQAVMECINQFCARRSYGKFLRAVGGISKHKKDIIKNGYGYAKSVRHFEKLLSSINVSSSEAYVYFEQLILVKPYETIYDEVVNYIASKGIQKRKAEMLVKTLRLSDALFEKALMDAL